jgi:hypothetical protein
MELVENTTAAGSTPGLIGIAVLAWPPEWTAITSDRPRAIRLTCHSRHIEELKRKCG